jgi:hypothetical protein
MGYGMWLERVIIARGEKILKPYRFQAEIFKKDGLTQYQEFLPHIEQSLKNASYWHGTGRYHYHHGKSSRYSRTPSDNILDVLGSIINDNGLAPHFDPWIPTDGILQSTISLATTRMHSRVFARAHQYENDSLLFELGTIAYWIRFYLILLLCWSLSQPRVTLRLSKNLFRTGTVQDIQTWASAIRKPKGKTVIGIFDLLRGRVPGSDIAGNYPLLFGVKKDNVVSSEVLPLIHVAEVRTKYQVTLESFTHVEVPFSKVRETEEFLRSRGIVLTVLPLEFVDMYVSTVPLQTLAYA